MLFPLGQIVCTVGAAEAAFDHDEDESGQTLAMMIQRHASGDWGDLDEHDWTLNERSVNTFNRLMSVYNLGKDRFYVITEADRSVTTILLPSEY
jgi:hypothetical protein